MVLLSCEENCSSTTDSPAVLGSGGVGGEREVGASRSGIREGWGEGEEGWEWNPLRRESRTLKENGAW